MIGCITLVDRDSNISDRVTIRAYKAGLTTDTPYTEYVFDKLTSKLLSRHTSALAYLPYTVAVEILELALALDKKTKHYIDMSFTYEPQVKLDVKIDRIVKEAFPLPNKALTYLPRTVFADVTSQLAGGYVLSNLQASLYAYNYNNMLISAGFRGDRIFHYSCGRLLMRTDWLMHTYKGRKQLKAFLPDSYDVICSASPKFIKSYSVDMKPKTRTPVPNDEFGNNFLKAHSLVSQRLADVDINQALTHPYMVSQLIEKQLEIYDYEFCRDYYSNLVSNVSSYKYLDIKDILRLHIDADFRVNLDKYISDIRKIYNANKDRARFECILSNGKMM